LAVLAYPAGGEEIISQRLKTLSMMGVTALFMEKREKKMVPVLLGKGHRGIVLKCVSEVGVCAAKLLRVDAPVSSLRPEWLMTSRASEVGVGPSVRGFTEDVLLLEYIAGKEIADWLEGRPARPELHKLLNHLLESCFKLDIIGLDHGQLTNASKHVIVRPDGQTTIIDYSKASMTRRPSNLTGITSFLTSKRTPQLEDMLRIGPEFHSVLRIYKRNPDQQHFNQVLGLLGLEPISAAGQLED